MRSVVIKTPAYLVNIYLDGDISVEPNRVALPDPEKKQVELGMSCGNIFCPANVQQGCTFNGGECPKWMPSLKPASQQGGK